MEFSKLWIFSWLYVKSAKEKYNKLNRLEYRNINFRHRGLVLRTHVREAPHSLSSKKLEIEQQAWTKLTGERLKVANSTDKIR